jgi:DNA-binding transcriptional MerR regulator
MASDRAHLLPIGRFAELTWLSPKMLRHYDRLGLLHPAHQDPQNGYRYYRPSQIRQAEVIRLLRDLDVPLDEIREVVDHPGADAVARVLQRQRGVMVSRRTETDRVIARVDRLLDESGLLPYEVGMVDLEPLRVVSHRQTVSQEGLEATHANLVAALESIVHEHGARIVERELTLYHNALWYGLTADMEVCLPLPDEADVVPDAWTLPGGHAARVLHRGSWDEIRSAYVALYSWVVEHGHETSAPVREAYLVDERDTDDPAEYVTSLTWPLG